MKGPAAMTATTEECPLLFTEIAPVSATTWPLGLRRPLTSIALCQLHSDNLSPFSLEHE